ncbi:MAG: hypothetical protein C6W56_00580 [Caldibacillus debilis]|nr:MAG: hypothetical protein BAA03_08920 [Caldibacillus debilis]REJ31242.1 MAG: hypothetical protein C6W56_00580 [Caldibacillus debilis]
MVFWRKIKSFFAFGRGNREPGAERKRPSAPSLLRFSAMADPCPGLPPEHGDADGGKRSVSSPCVYPSAGIGGRGRLKGTD